MMECLVLAIVMVSFAGCKVLNELIPWFSAILKQTLMQLVRVSVSHPSICLRA